PDEDDDDRRAFWRLWDLYRQRPRRAGWWIGSSGRCVFSPDGSRAAVIRESRVTIHDAATGTILTEEFDTRQTDLQFAAFNRDGNRLGLVSRADGSITVWDLGPVAKPRARLQSAGPTRHDPRLGLVGPLSGATQEKLREAEKRTFFTQIHLCFLDADRVLIADPDAGTVWKLDGPQQIDRVE